MSSYSPDDQRVGLARFEPEGQCLVGEPFGLVDVSGDQLDQGIGVESGPAQGRLAEPVCDRSALGSAGPDRGHVTLDQQTDDPKVQGPEAAVVVESVGEPHGLFGETIKLRVHAGRVERDAGLQDRVEDHVTMPGPAGDLDRLQGEVDAATVAAEGQFARERGEQRARVRALSSWPTASRAASRTATRSVSTWPTVG